MRFEMILKTLLVSVFATSVEANVYAQCDEAIQQNNKEAVIRLSKTIKRFNTFSGDGIEAAERCVSAAEGRPMILSLATTTFVPADELEQHVKTAIHERRQKEENDRKLHEDAEMQRQKDAESQLQAALAAQRLEDRNKSLIGSDVHLACKTLYYRDFITAMTNAVCVESFYVNSHPRLHDD